IRAQQILEYGGPVCSEPVYTASFLYSECIQRAPYTASQELERRSSSSLRMREGSSAARTLMGNPMLLLLDEPSEGVAPIIVEDLANTLLILKQQGLSILLSEQNVAFAQIIADRVYMLEKGQIRWIGTTEELVRNSELQRSYLAL